MRKLVTVLFADVVGSTDLGERHDPEHYRRVLAAYFDRVRAIVVRHGGTVEKFIGDAVMAVFGLPTVHEDDALRAVRAADEIRRDVAAMASAAAEGDVALRWRIGVNTGEVSAGGRGDHTFATGDAINLAARLEQAAGPGQVVIGRSTHDLVRDAVTATRLPDLDVRGKAFPVIAYRLDGVAASAAGRARRLDQPFVGRTEELALLAWVRRRALATPAIQLVTIHGTAGVGKTRLAHAALSDSDVPVLWGRCLPYGDGVTYWPVAEALSAAADVGPGDDVAAITAGLARLAGGRASPGTVGAVAAGLGLTDEAVARDGDVTDVLRSYLLAVAGDDGLVVVVDDVHHAEPPLLDLLESLSRARPAPLLVVAIARPELLESRPGWAGGTPNSIALSLEPLGVEDTAAMLGARLPGAIEPVLRDRLVGAAAGNPLFLEELVTVLLERDELRRDADGRWSVADPAAPLVLPTSVHTVLAARVDSLAASDRTLLGRLSICGERFEVASVHALVPELTRDDVVDRLEVLVDRELLRPAGDAYVFRHQFVRDAVYAGLPRRVRAELHERYAGWLDAQATSPQRDEFVAHHLGRAVAEREELDPRDPTLGALRVDASHRMETAGRRALARGAMSAAARLLGRAIAVASGDRDVDARVLAEHGRALAETGDFAAADRELARAVDAAAATGDRALVHHTRLTALWVRSNLDLAGWCTEAWTASAEAIDAFQAIGDEGGLGRAWGLRAEVHYLQAAYKDAEEAMHRAEAHARAAGDATEERESAVAAASTLVPGATPTDAGLLTCDALDRRFAGDATVEARVLLVRAPLLAMRGDGDGARAALTGAVERFEELGQGYWLASASATEGYVESLVGGREAAEIAWRRALETFERMGDRAQAATVAATLAVALPDDRADDVAELTLYARRHAHPDDLDARVRSLLADAHLAVSRGEPGTALRAVDDAVGVAEPSDALVLRADGQLARGRALHRDGRTADATRAVELARERYAAKGHLVGVARTDALLGAPHPRHAVLGG